MKKYLKDTFNYQIMLEHFAPEDNLVSYGKLINFATHNRNRYQQICQDIEQDTSYYLFKDEETLKEYSILQSKLEEWEFILEILKERWELIVI